MLPAVELVYPVARTALLPPLQLGMRWTIEGAHLIPARGPVILASNHTSYLDPLVLAYLADRRHRRVRFLAKAELFEKRGLGPLLRDVQPDPGAARHRGRGRRRSTRPIAALGRGECVAVFPEGTISLDLEPMAGKSGTARLAAATRRAGHAGRDVGRAPDPVQGAEAALADGRRRDRGRRSAGARSRPDERRARTPPTASWRRSAACVARAREIYPQRPTAGRRRLVGAARPRPPALRSGTRRARRDASP